MFCHSLKLTVFHSPFLSLSPSLLPLCLCTLSIHFSVFADVFCVSVFVQSHAVFGLSTAHPAHPVHCHYLSFSFSPLFFLTDGCLNPLLFRFHSTFFASLLSSERGGGRSCMHTVTMYVCHSTSVWVVTFCKVD